MQRQTAAIPRPKLNPKLIAGAMPRRVAWSLCPVVARHSIPPTPSGAPVELPEHQVGQGWVPQWVDAESVSFWESFPATISVDMDILEVPPGS